MITSITDAAALEMLDALKRPQTEGQLMSDPNNDGGAVYPYSNNSEKEYYWINKGMTLRDYFAGQALAGILAGSGDKTGFVDYDEKIVARSAWGMADAMIAARKEGRP